MGKKGLRGQRGNIFNERTNKETLEDQITNVYQKRKKEEDLSKRRKRVRWGSWVGRKRPRPNLHRNPKQKAGQKSMWWLHGVVGWGVW